MLLIIKFSCEDNAAYCAIFIGGVFHGRGPSTISAKDFKEGSRTRDVRWDFRIEE